MDEKGEIVIVVERGQDKLVNSKVRNKCLHDRCKSTKHRTLTDPKAFETAMFPKPAIFQKQIRDGTRWLVVEIIDNTQAPITVTWPSTPHRDAVVWMSCTTQSG